MAGRFLLLLALLLPFPPALAEMRLDGSDGVTVTLPAPARRIVSLAPHLTDTLLAIGARARLAGAIDDRERLGAGARPDGLPVVGDAGGLNYEAVLALRPDLVLAWGGGTPRAWIERLRALGLPVLVLEARRLEDIAGELLLLGRAADAEAAAAREAATLHRRLDRLRAQGAAGHRLTYFYQAWRQPLYTLHGGHLLSQALALCGADNIVPPGPVAAPLVGPELVLRSDPDVLVVAATDLAASRAWWGRFGSLSAVRGQRFLGVDDPRLTRPGPGMLSAVEPVCTQFSTWRKQPPPKSR